MWYTGLYTSMPLAHKNVKQWRVFRGYNVLRGDLFLTERKEVVLIDDEISFLKHSYIWSSQIKRIT